MSYVDAVFNRNTDTIHVIERHNGERIYREFPAKYTFYYKDPKGKYKSVFGDPLTRVVCKNTKDFRKEVAINKHKELFESDINPIFQCLSENYLNQDAPKLNVAFFDIEVDFSPTKGFAPPDDPFMPITAIAIDLQWLDTMICLAVPPKTYTMEQAQALVDEHFENTYLFENDAELLKVFLDVIKDADVLSGWNSEFFDIPYVVNRIKRVLSKDDTRKLCLLGQLPTRRELEKHGKTAEVYELTGRIHLDYLNLYKKYTFEERHSYSLDAISEYELDNNKVPYEGTLDQLYNNDFKLFLEYNIKDTRLVNNIDKKLQYIDLSNQLAHSNTVMIQTTMGAVAVTEQAIINEAHRRGLQVQNRKRRDDEKASAAGAYVAFPKKGLHKWIGSMDLNSLYPSVIRALNMAPETIIGQIRPEYSDQRVHEDMTLRKKTFAGSWEGKFSTEEYDFVMEQRKDITLTVDWESGTSDNLSGAELYKLIFDSHMPWMLSANGTIFTTEFEGVISGLLKRWYSERKELQAMKKKAEDANNEAEIAFWDKRQLVKKINLNSLYGAILNEGCRFFDKRIGQSTTLTGRQIVKHMSAEINKTITGVYDHVGEAVIYGDSVTGDTLIRLEDGSTDTIESLFNNIQYKVIQDSGKEYAIPTSEHDDRRVLGYNSYNDEAVYHSISYVMRHATEKKKFKITSDYGKTVVVTEDHSLMVDRGGFIEEVKPTELLENDLLITVSGVDTARETITSVNEVEVDDEYVYDISVANGDPFFFANDLLMHNTDSVYFSAYPIIKQEIQSGKLEWNKDKCVELYDHLCAQADSTFSDFMQKAFHCLAKRAEVIKAGREIVASSGLFITKKRYAALVYDDEGIRKDVNGNPGKVKAMGLDLRRSDTPTYMQKFLMEILIKTLTNNDTAEIVERITDFRNEFQAMPGWEKGSPKKANKIYYYQALEQRKGKANMPGHVRASINWNTLKRMNGDQYSEEIVDGMKVIVCKLKPNPLGYTSVAYPVDQLRLPEWFKELPFDDDAMAETIIDNKLENLIGVLDFDLSVTKQNNTFSSLFDID